MKLIKFLTAISVSMVMVTVSAVAVEQNRDWPREQVSNGNVLVMQQPQIDDWKTHSELYWRMAFTLTTPGDQQAPGVVSLRGDTNVDDQSRMVLVSNIKVISINFTNLNPGQTSEMSALLMTFIPKTMVIPLDQIEASTNTRGNAHDHR